MGPLGYPSGPKFLRVFEISKPFGTSMAPAAMPNMGIKNRVTKKSLKPMIVGALQIGLGPLNFRVLCFLKSDGTKRGVQNRWQGLILAIICS